MAGWKGIVGKGFRPDDFRDYVDGLTFADWRPQFVVVHNTSAPRLSQWHSTPGAQRMLNLQSYYRDQMKWSAGPHLFVADDLIWAFTPLTTSGVHSPSWNAISWGVEIVGEFQEETFSDAIRSNAVDALAVLHEKLGLDPQHLRFHKEDPRTTHKTCPGKNVIKPDLIAAVAQRLVSLNPGEHLQAPAGGAALGVPSGGPVEAPAADMEAAVAKAPVGLAKDMETAKLYAAAIKKAATKYNLSPSLICALGSRESGWGLGAGMKPKGPAGTGDWAPRNPSRYGYAMPPDGLGWGRGLLQIDYQQTFAQTGDWQDPEANILYGCAELAGNIAYFTKSSAGQSYDPQRAGIAGYNCGRGNVTKAIKAGYDVDRYTAGNNYSQDVINRMKWFQQEGFDQFVNAPAGLEAAAAAGMTVTVHTGHRYRATVTLSWLEQQFATNAMIAGQFAQLGFTHVSVTGDGPTRLATGLWNGPDTTVPLDSHLSNVVDLGKATVAAS